MGRKSAELSDEKKNLIVKLSTTVRKKSELSRLVGIPRTTITSILKKVQATGSTRNIPRKGRPNLFTKRDKNAALRLAKVNRRSSLKDITNKLNEEKQHHFSERTVQRALRSEGYRRRIAKKKAIVREVNRKKRVKWCKERKNLTVNDHWKKVIFSDESQVVIGAKNRVYIWRKDDEKYRPHLICPKPKHKLSLMIWGCVCNEGIGTLAAVQGNINSVKYIDILENNLWPAIVWYFDDDNYIFMDDNATVHRSHLLDAYKTENGLNSMEWPAQSPDFNVIEKKLAYCQT